MPDSKPAATHAGATPPPPEHRSASLVPPPETPVPPSPHRKSVAPRTVDAPGFQSRLDELVRECGGDPAAADGRLISDMLLTSLKLATDGRDTGELKLMSMALKELRYAYNVFAQHSTDRRVSIFGSARTPPEHTDYKAAVEFSRKMAAAGWGVITGAGDGIMKAGHEGPGRESSFGLSIRLPFENNANSVIKGDPKLISFRYFFTRKLMFVSQCDAVVCFPGGFGTQDETFEALTLVQTGKGAMMPVVFLEGEGHGYWRRFDDFVRSALLDGKFISPEDTRLYYIAKDPADAVAHVQKFYRNFHSARYFKDDLIIRLNRPLKDRDVAELNKQFGGLVRSGAITQRGPYDAESDALHLPRIAFTHTRRQIGVVRHLIDAINDCDPA